jgi:hypothetical protein
MCPYQVKVMVKQCWDENPDRRPPFSEIVDELSKVQKGKKTNIVDNMMKMLEEYSDGLEGESNVIFIRDQNATNIYHNDFLKIFITNPLVV